jgi:hypothetical protein
MRILFVKHDTIEKIVTVAHINYYGEAFPAAHNRIVSPSDKLSNCVA